MTTKIKKQVLNDFAQRNQYSTWKQVVKDKQSMSFDAKEFEEVIGEMIHFTLKKVEEIVNERIVIVTKDRNKLKEFKGIGWKKKYFTSLKIIKTLEELLLRIKE